jgi:hypothetical protein
MMAPSTKESAIMKPVNANIIPLAATLLAIIPLIGMQAYAAQDTTPAAQATYWNTQAGKSGDAARGKQFFSSTHGKTWSCTSCHQNPPTTPGKHASTGKVIDPLAPAANAQAFTNTQRINKWFKRNCNDVLGRECVPQEKADVLAYLISLRP